MKISSSIDSNIEYRSNVLTVQFIIYIIIRDIHYEELARTRYRCIYSHLSERTMRIIVRILMSRNVNFAASLAIAGVIIATVLRRKDARG